MFGFHLTVTALSSVLSLKQEKRELNTLIPDQATDLCPKLNNQAIKLITICSISFMQHTAMLYQYTVIQSGAWHYIRNLSHLYS